jgi:hypothetical protein
MAKSSTNSAAKAGVLPEPENLVKGKGKAKAQGKAQGKAKAETKSKRAEKSPKPELDQGPPSLASQASSSTAVLALAPAPPIAVVVKKEQEADPIPTGEGARMLMKLKYMKGKGNMAYEHYQSLDKAAKRRFYWDEFSVDPKCSKYSVVDTHNQTEATKEGTSKGWVLPEMVLQLQGIPTSHPQYAALLVACVEGLPKRPHENPAMAALGMWQYQYEHVNMVENAITESRSRELRQDTPVANPDGLQLMEAAANLGVGGRGVKRGLPNPPKASAPKTVAEWETSYTKAHGKYTKTLQDMSALVSKWAVLEKTLQSTVQSLSDKGETPLIGQAYLSELRKKGPMFDEYYRQYLLSQTDFTKACPDNEGTARRQEAALHKNVEIMQGHVSCFGELLSQIVKLSLIHS